MSRRILILVAFVWCLPAVARAQLTPEEYNQFNRLIAESDTKTALEIRMKLIGDAIDREGNLKPNASPLIPVDMKRARIPVAEGSAFLLQRIDHASDAVRRTVVRMLGAYGVEAKAAAPAVLERIKKETALPVRTEAILAFSKMAPRDAEGAGVILELLTGDEKDNTTNKTALQALIAMSAVVPKSAEPRIAKALQNRATELALLAHELIGKMHALDRPTMEQLRTMKEIDWQETPDHGYSVLASIGDAGVKGEFAVPLLVGVLESMPPVYLECAAFDAMMKTRTGNPKAITAMLDRMGGKDFYVRIKARAALGFADTKEPAAARALAEGLRHQDLQVRFGAATELRSRDQTLRLPPAAHAEMLEPLLATLAELDDMVPLSHLEAYIQLLRRFGPKAAAAGEPIVKFYQSESYFKKLGSTELYVRGKLLAVLANVGVPESGRTLVLEALKKGPVTADNGFAFAAAARAASSFADAEETTPLLLPGLLVKGPELALYFIDWSDVPGQGKPTTVRLEAARALGKLGAGAKEALPFLRELAEGKADSPITLDLPMRQEARRAYQAISGTPLPPAKGVFADGKKNDNLHLDERLKVPMLLKLRNARPQDVLKRLQDATKLQFTMDENVDPNIPVWAFTTGNMPAFQTMRSMANATPIQGVWEDVGDGYRLIGKKWTDEEKIARIPRAQFPPFKDDSFDPLYDDPRLKNSIALQLKSARIEDILQVIRDGTGVTLAAENVDKDAIIYGSISSPGTPAWSAMRNLAEHPRIQGEWVIAGEGYRLRGTAPIQPKLQPPPVVIAQPIPQLPTQPKVEASRSVWGFYACLGTFTAFALLAVGALVYGVLGRKIAI